LTKDISLVLTAPMALVKLRETGTCQIALDEVLFENDHPGQYFRRLRSVALTVCAVANVVSHGTGHAIGFDDPGHSVPFFPFSPPEFVRTVLLREPPDVMMQGQALG
jgi:hypothetical protein